MAQLTVDKRLSREVRFEAHDSKMDRRSIVVRMIAPTLIFLLLILPSCVEAECVVESAKSIPVAYDVDIVVVGGSTAGVAAACEARRNGASVFLISDRPYVGIDMCAYQRLWLEPGEKPISELDKAVFGDGRWATPLAVKTAMDEALLRAGVPYLTGCYATEALFDENGNIAGIVMANRSGRQAVKAKVVIDGSRHAVLARQTTAVFRGFKPGKKTFQFIVVGGEMQRGRNLLGRKLDVTYDNPTSKSGGNAKYPVYEYTVSVDMKDGSPASFAAAEQEVRNLVTGRGAKDCSEMLYFLPDDTVVGESRIDGPWAGAGQYDISACRPHGVPRLYVLSAHADMDNVAAKKMLRPLEFMAIGRRIGREAATLAKTLTSPDRIEFRGTSPDSSVIDIDFVGEDLRGLRSSKQLGMISSKERSLPVFGQYDVVVVGGGTSGAPAGISATRRGSKTLVIEYLDELGGTGTAGLIGSYWRGNRRGFTKEINDGIGVENSWDVVAKSEWLRRELLRNGTDIWFCSFGCGAVVANGRVTGVVVATHQGRGVVLAKTIIDATGNSDIAFCAGAETQFGVSPLGVLSVQLAGFPHRNLGDNYNNTCYTMVDDTDVVDVWHLMTSMRIAYGGRKAPPYDVGQLVDSRERRRIIGEYILTTHDILNQRTHPDTISQHMSNFDAASFPDSEMLLVYDMKGPDYHVDMPYRCLIPKGLDGILVTGLGASVERDAMTLVRMQADLQNQGYAAGMAAAMAADLNGCTRKIDIKKVQQQMVKEGVLKSRVIRDRDSYPMDDSIIAGAVKDVKELSRQHDQSRKVATKSMKALAVIMAHPERSKTLLREAYKKSSTRNERINYAKILSILGDNTGVPILIADVDAQTKWDEGYPYTSGRKVGNVFSDLDRLIIAIGYSRDPRALEPLLRKMDILKPTTVLSHYKAMTLALKHLISPRAIGPLVRLLEKPGFRGHAVTNPAGNERGAVGLPSRRSFGELNAAFKEVIIAATLYQCGDYQKMGCMTLEQYSLDVNGHFASYAQAVLQGKGLPK